MKGSLGRRTRRRRKTRKQKGGNSLNIRYGSIHVAGQRLNSSLTQTAPSVSIGKANKQPSLGRQGLPNSVNVPEGHTLIMYDPDAPAGTWLHWLKGAQEEFWPYQPPSPPSGTHRYIFRLVEGEPVKSAIKQSGIDPKVILPGNVKGEVMFIQS